jgi:hypothetical protein
VRLSAETETKQVGRLTVGALIAWMYAVGTVVRASSSSPAMPHRCPTDESSVPARTILSVCIVTIMLVAA